jgi:hypothetical protein
MGSGDPGRRHPALRVEWAAKRTGHASGRLRARAVGYLRRWPGLHGNDVARIQENLHGPEFLLVEEVIPWP